MYQRISGAIQEKELHPFLHFGIVVNEKGPFNSPSTAVAKFGFVLFALILWHCRLFNAKSIFMHINSSISNNSL